MRKLRGMAKAGNQSTTDYPMVDLPKDREEVSPVLE
jgi:hypothetical protein